MDILKSGAANWQDQVIEFLQTHNLAAEDKEFKFSYILWALRDKAFFKKVITVLRDRFIFDADVWSYGFYHLDDEEICREFLESADGYSLSDEVGNRISTKLLKKNLED